MKIRSNHDSDFGITYYVHSFKKVFEELPPGIDIEYFKKSKSKAQYTMEAKQDEKSGHRSKYIR